MAEPQRGSAGEAPHLSVDSYPFREGYAAVAEAIVDAEVDELWEALLDVEDFHHHVPAIDRSTLSWIDETTARCELAGRLGVWKFGIPLNFRYRMKVSAKRRLELVDYEEGNVRDVYFLHEVEPLPPGRSRLRSTFYFDLTGFPLLTMFKIFERHPWMAEMLNLTAAAMLVRSFQLRWEPGEN